MGMARLELAWPYGRQILSLLWIPISPHAQGGKDFSFPAHLPSHLNSISDPNHPVNSHKPIHHEVQQVSQSQGIPHKSNTFHH